VAKDDHVADSDRAAGTGKSAIEEARTSPYNEAVHDVPRRIGQKYGVIELLGEGGMGRVYLAEDMDLGRKVAIKVLSENLAGNREYTERFRREARAVAAIGHPNIVQVHEIGMTDEGCPFLVMELLEGSDLHDVLNTVGVLSVERAVDLMGQVLFALSAAHRVGIVHRDLKPENIYLTSRAVTTWSDFEDTTSNRRSPETAKILDFGISRFIEPVGSTAPQLTQSGVVLGTPFYIAPEQIRDVAHVDGRADLFAVGVILFECLTGALPFTGDNVHTILHNVLAQPTPDPLARRPDLPEGIAAVIQRAMEKDPARRFQDADAFIEALMPYARKSSKKSNSWTGGRPFELPFPAQGDGEADEGRGIPAFDSGELVPVDDMVDAVTMAVEKGNTSGVGPVAAAASTGEEPWAAVSSPAAAAALPRPLPQLASPAPAAIAPAFESNAPAATPPQIGSGPLPGLTPAGRQVGRRWIVFGIAAALVVVAAAAVGVVIGLGGAANHEAGAAPGDPQGAAVGPAPPPVPVHADAGFAKTAVDAGPAAREAGPAVVIAPADAGAAIARDAGPTKTETHPPTLARDTAVDEALARARSRLLARDRAGCLAALNAVRQTSEVLKLHRRCLALRPRRGTTGTKTPSKSGFERDNPFGSGR
jgi:serine/threonine-protein kinase